MDYKELTALAALVGLSVWLIKFLTSKVWSFIAAQQRTITNHIDHSTKALEQLSGIIHENTEATKELRHYLESLGDLRRPRS